MLDFVLGRAAMATNEIRMAYIESELAKRQQRSLGPVSPSAAPASGITSTSSVDASSAVADSQRTAVTAAIGQRQPASLGKLHEIDLGQEAKLENIARTQAATRRLAGEPNPAPDDDTTTNEARLGKDGKPWRHRKGRTSEDIERDRLVEEILRESKCEHVPAFFFPEISTYLLTTSQWKYTTSRMWNRDRTTKLPTTASPSSSAASSSTPFRRVDVRRGRERRARRPKPRLQRGPSWAAVGARVRPCARCRTRPVSGEIWVSQGLVLVRSWEKCPDLRMRPDSRRCFCRRLLDQHLGSQNSLSISCCTSTACTQVIGIEDVVGARQRRCFMKVYHSSHSIFSTLVPFFPLYSSYSSPAKLPLPLNQAGKETCDLICLRTRWA